ncbi:MAG: GNAT family N-acetyltransferase [Cyclobacteriaceae bacterium]|nr:GNAT family N-acetyltransferase [Cyclobacteriaceae bacterium]
MIEIREATSHDIPDMREVAISSYADTFGAFNSPENMEAFFKNAYSIKKLEEELLEPQSRLLLAFEGNTQVGFLRLRECDEVIDLLGNNTIELQRLYVLTSAQGKSVGRLLMETAMAYAQQKKYEWIWLGVWEKNFRAQRFYENWGFEKFSEHTFWMGDDPQVDWLLKRKL